MKNTVAFASGLLFALGLGIGGMTQPAKVIGFLDVGGDWDPSLALVMVGALLVYGVVARRALLRPAPLLDSAFFLPTRRDIDASLVVGATLFGVGWGLGGLCPGPAVVSLASGRAPALVFAVAMLAGIWAGQRWVSRRPARPRLAPAAASLLLVLLAASAHAAAPEAVAPSGGVRREMLVDTDWLASHLQDRGLVVLHAAKTREGYDRGHVPGARFVGFGEVATSRAGVPNELPPLAELTALVRRLGITGAPGERIVIYGEDEGLEAARVYVALDYLGLAGAAALLDGQWAAWQAEQRPVSTEAPAVATSGVLPRLRPDRIVARNAVEDASYAAVSLPRSAVALIDARPRAQYSGAEPGDGVSRPGHIPGAGNVFWKENLQSGAIPRLRAPDELRALYAKAGVVPDDLVVTYCRTGAQASHSYFVLAYLGYDVRLYDASFIEWSADPSTAVAR